MAMETASMQQPAGVATPVPCRPPVGTGSERRGRALLSWVNGPDLRNLFYGACVSNPAEFDEFLQLWHGAQTKAATLDAMPDGRQDVREPARSLGHAIAGVRQSETFRVEYEPHGVAFASVPISDLLTPQYWVDMDYVEELVGQVPAEGDDLALFRYCFSTGWLRPPTIIGGRIATFSSRRRDLSQPCALHLDSYSPQEVRFSVAVRPRPNFVWVTSIEESGRLLITNGVHHLLALLMAGRDRAYCLFRRASISNALLNLNDPAIFKPNRLIAPRPPLLHDFADGPLYECVSISDHYQFLRVAVNHEIGVVPSL